MMGPIDPGYPGKAGEPWAGEFNAFGVLRSGSVDSALARALMIRLAELDANSGWALFRNIAVE
jgi:hypothetical protein